MRIPHRDQGESSSGRTLGPKRRSVLETDSPRCARRDRPTKIGNRWIAKILSTWCGGNAWWTLLQREIPDFPGKFQACYSIIFSAMCGQFSSLRSESLLCLSYVPHHAGRSTKPPLISKKIRQKKKKTQINSRRSFPDGSLYAVNDFPGRMCTVVQLP